MTSVANCGHSLVGEEQDTSNNNDIITEGKSFLTSPFWAHASLLRDTESTNWKHSSRAIRFKHSDHN